MASGDAVLDILPHASAKIQSLSPSMGCLPPNTCRQAFDSSSTAVHCPLPRRGEGGVPRVTFACVPRPALFRVIQVDALHITGRPHPKCEFRGPLSLPNKWILDPNDKSWWPLRETGVLGASALSQHKVDMMRLLFLVARPTRDNGSCTKLEQQALGTPRPVAVVNGVIGRQWNGEAGTGEEQHHRLC